MKLKVGARYYSQTCATEVIVIKAPSADDVALTCGGEPMLDTDPVKAGITRGEPTAGDREGTKLGKRYRDGAATLQLLVVKPGEGTLSVGGEPLVAEDAKALPSSD